MNIRSIVTVLLTAGLILPGTAKDPVKGMVFLDLNKNCVKDKEDTGMGGVLVSNGREVVETNQSGNWTLPLSDDSLFFVIKPAGYAVPLNGDMIPQYYYLLSSPTSEGETAVHGWPESIDFPLHRQNESARFSVLLFGDPQARGLREVNFITRDVVEECIGTDAIFGITLGDIVAEDPNLFAEISQSIGKIGIPWYNIFGNHDSDHQAKDNHERDKTFEHYFGPSSYAYEYGEAVFIALNNIFFKPGGKYRPGFTPNQIDFVRNYLSTVPENKLIVMMMHAPIIACERKEEIFRLIENRPHTLSISAHLHEQVHLFVDEKFGWRGAQQHHHFINATVSGSWWCGLIDEVGIPHATMNDGGPNGYSIITFDSTTYRIIFKAARRPADYQMNIYLPDDIARTGLDTTNISVNIFAGSERSTVEMKFDSEEEWKNLIPVITIDPEVLRMHNLSPYLDEKVKGLGLEEIFGWKMDYPSKSRHMWRGTLPGNLPAGTRMVTIRTTDMFDQTYQAHKIFRIRE
jgi:hypothetical protein